MTSLEALALSYGFTSLAAFAIMAHAVVTGFLNHVIPAWRAGVIPNVPATLAEHAPFRRFMLSAALLLCFVFAAAWPACAIAWVVLKVLMGMLNRYEPPELAELHGSAGDVCDCAGCSTARMFTDSDGKPHNRLDELRELVLEPLVSAKPEQTACPNCERDLYEPGLIFHEPTDAGVCISQWDDMAVSGDLLERMQKAGLS